MGFFSDIGLGGWGMVARSGHRKDLGSNTADGGRNSRVDLFIDNDAPIKDHVGGFMYDLYGKSSARDRKRQMWCVSLDSRRGGSGLYHDEEDSKE